MFSINRKHTEEIIEMFGKDETFDIAVEELAELIQAIQKCKRCERNDSKVSDRISLFDNLIEEMTHSAMAIDRICCILGISQKMIDREVYKVSSRLDMINTNIEDQTRRLK